MIKIAGNKNYNPHPIFYHKIYDRNLTANTFVVPWQMEETGKERRDAQQLDLNFGIYNQEITDLINFKS